MKTKLIKENQIQEVSADDSRLFHENNEELAYWLLPFFYIEIKILKLVLNPLGWKYSSGFINEAMIKEHMPPAGPDTQILMCGPPAMVQFACIPNLEKNGFSTDMHFAF